MFKRTFVVVFRPVKNNFLLLPSQYYGVVSTYDTGCLRLQYATHTHYASWAPHAGTVKDTEIGINARVAKEIGLRENDLVKCSLVADVMALKNVYVTPVSSKDWEIIELSCEKISNILLTQTRIVNLTQILVVWVNKSIQVAFTVDRVKPNANYGRIDHTTELIVAPNFYNNLNDKDAYRSQEKTADDAGNKLSRSRTTASLRSGDTDDEFGVQRSTTVSNVKKLNRFESLAKAKRGDKMISLLKELRRENFRSFEFRVIGGDWQEKAQISDIYVLRSNLPSFMELNTIYRLRTSAKSEYYVRVHLVDEDSTTMPFNMHPAIEVNVHLMKLLDIKQLEKVVLKAKPMLVNLAEKIELFAHKKTHYKIVENAFKHYIMEKTNSGPILLNQREVIRLEEDLVVSVGIVPEYYHYCLIDAQILKDCKIYAADVVNNVDDVLNVKTITATSLSVRDLIKLPDFDEIVDQLVDELKVNLCLDRKNSVLRQGNVLIAGASGTGKSILVERVLNQLMHNPYYCYYDIFHCVRNKGRKSESIQKDLRSMFTTCLQNAPSILVLENLDKLAHVAGDQPTQDGEYYNRVADTVHQLIVQYTRSNPIAVIASVSDLQALNRRLYSSRGRHLFQTVKKLPGLEQAARETIIEELCSHISSEKLDFVKFANLTEGYNNGDLVQFVERAIFYAYRRNKSRPVLTNENLIESLGNTNSYCLQGIQTNQKLVDDSADDANAPKDIPGLEPVVTVLEEVLRWPSMYPGIFNASPLRVQAGVLLYGPPGTGKTYLVSRIAASWNMRMISVKGPELLARYIGQSEENVRNLFNRARSARPCVLFFDEFDSLAPKRGHDSTGVTDRVVNQLLTELDGIEGVQGVTVIAATSRPELLDPALLRSGRLDRLVECPLPDVVARQRIFEMLSSSLLLDDSVDFDYFAPKTQNYTGADIQSILTTANMNAVRETLSQIDDNRKLPQRSLVRQLHLREAFQATRPSLSHRDVIKYQKAYARFISKDKSSREFTLKHATLA